MFSCGFVAAWNILTSEMAEKLIDVNLESIRLIESKARGIPTEASIIFDQV